MSYALWENLFTGDANRIKKALYGSFLVRDYAYAATSLTSYTPFDPVTGHLSSTLLTTDGWFDIGDIDENGVQFSPKYTTADVMIWQDRMAQRTDVTLDQEECSVTAAESTPLVDHLNYQMPLANLPTTGTVGYHLTKSKTPVIRARQVLAIGVDGSGDEAEYFGTLYSRALMIKPDKYDYQAKTEIQTPLTFDSYPDPYSGFAVRRFREGPAWRAAGGNTEWDHSMVAPVATAGATGTATLAFEAPVSDNGPFTYKVTKTVASTTTAVPDNAVTIVSTTGGTTTLSITGLAAAATTFRVVATGANGSDSAPSAESNSATIT